MTGPLLALAVMSAAATAEDQTIAAQKERARANMKKSGVEKSASVETADLLVFAAVPDAKAKPLADAVQKAFAYTKSVLKFEDSEALWPGKLTVYVFPGRASYAAFVRAVEQRQPEKGVWYAINPRADPPYVTVGGELGERTTDAEVQADAAAVVAAALLTRKAGAALPEWLLLGFGRAMYSRTEGGAKLAAYKARSKAAVLGTKARPVPVRAADVWEGTQSKNRDLIAASLAEYLAVGPEAAKFPKFLAGFKPTEQVESPTVATALEAAEWKPDALETGWKRWVATGK